MSAEKLREAIATADAFGARVVLDRDAARELLAEVLRLRAITEQRPIQCATVARGNDCEVEPGEAIDAIGGGE